MLKLKMAAAAVYLFSSLSVRAQAWLEVPYKFEYSSARTMYWDTTAGWFYVAGEMAELNGKKIKRMFRFNENGVVDYMDTIHVNMETVLSFAKYKDTLYHFGYAGMKTYVDSSWSTKLSGSVFYEAFVYKGELLIGGYFENAVSPDDGGVITYDGAGFSPFHDIKTVLAGGSVSAFADYKGKLYMGGNFEGDYNEIISWDGTDWDNMKGGIPGSAGWENISDLVIYKDELYVGGVFFSETGSPSNHILKWDGTDWYVLGEGLFGQGISDMLVYNDELWVIGAFDSVQGLHLGNIGIWNGSHWCNTGAQFDFMPDCGAVFGDTLYVGGNFKHIDGDSSLAYLVKYNPDAPRICGDPVSVRPVGVEDRYGSSKQKIKLYPNPSKGDLTVESGPEQYGEITIRGMTGEVLYTEKISGTERIRLRLPPELANGMYLLQFKGTDSVHFGTFILDR